MAGQLSEFYATVENMIAKLDEAYVLVERKLASVSEPDLDATNWSAELWAIQNAKNQLRILSSVHVFERLSRAQMQAVFDSATDGVSSGKVTYVIEHTRRDFDTLRSLEVEYGVPWQDILLYNNITAEEFETADSVQIPYPRDLAEVSVKDVPVLGDQQGLKILGTDLPETLVEGSDGDLKVLTPEDSFAQEINILSKTRPGQIPYYEDFGIDLDFEDGLPGDVIEALAQLRVSEAITADPRVREIEAETVRESNKVTVNTTIETVRGSVITTRIGV